MILINLFNNLHLFIQIFIKRSNFILNQEFSYFNIILNIFMELLLQNI
jgi:hypothetical protein